MLINVSKGTEVQVHHLNDVNDGLQTVSMHRGLGAEQLFHRKDYGPVNISKGAEDRMQHIDRDLNAGLHTVRRMPMQGRLVGMQLVVMQLSQNECKLVTMATSCEDQMQCCHDQLIAEPTDSTPYCTAINGQQSQDL